METEYRIERTIGLVIVAVLAIGCVLVLRPSQLAGVRAPAALARRP